MDNRRIGWLDIFLTAACTRLAWLAVFWIWVHSAIGKHFLSEDHPYKKKTFSINDVANGEYIGQWPAILLGMLAWGLLTLLCIMSIAVFF